MYFPLLNFQGGGRHKKRPHWLSNWILVDFKPYLVLATKMNSTIFYLNTTGCLPDKAEKCFQGLYELQPSKTILVILSVILTLVNLILSSGIIWFEKFGSDQRRTLLNKLVSMVSSRLVHWMVICQTGDIIRYSFGPLPTSVCSFVSIYKASVRFQVQLIFVAMYVTKYIFVLHLKNPSAITEDFWSIFINLLIHGCSNIFNVAIFVLDERKPVNFYTCADLDMAPVVNLPKRSYGIAELISLVIIVLVQARIYFFKKKLNDSHQVYCMRPKHNSLESFISTLVPIVTLGIMVLYTKKINSASHLEVNSFPNNLHMQIYQLLVPNLVSLILTLTYYIQHHVMRNAILQVLRETLSSNSWYSVAH